MPPKKPLTAEQLLKRDQRYFSQRIRRIFRNAGFIYLPTGGTERTFGFKKGELDSVFVHDNIILVCEETLHQSSKVKNHLKNKKLLFDEIKNNMKEFLEWLRKDFPEQLEDVDEYAVSRYKIFFLYLPKHGVDFDDNDRKLLSPAVVVDPSTLNYIQTITTSIKHSARSEIFRYLKLNASDLGPARSVKDTQTIPTTIIYPDDNTGLQNGIKMVSFMLSAQTLLNNAYVLRKDNWDDSIELYQRLIERDRINQIRKYLAKTKTPFINNIIVSLPDGTKFEDGQGNPVEPSTVETFDGHRMLIPNELNSICVIDGQHRIYAHFEGTNPLEPEIAKLRKKFHLLVTGIIFPPNMSSLQRRRYESELFLNINSEAKQVPADVILFIETLKDPFSDFGIARKVLERMNQQGVFKNLFQLSRMEQSKIKTASIIKFALRYVVEINNDPSRPTLFHYWSTSDKRSELLKHESNILREEYVQWCASTIGMYFAGVKAAFDTDWNDDSSKILSTTSINGFLIAFRRSLPALGILSFDEYKGAMTKLKIDFAPKKFEFASSQYGKFSRQILSGPMGLAEVDETWIKAKK